MFQGDWGMLHQQEKWAVRGFPDCPFLQFVYTNALLAKDLLKTCGAS